MINKIIALIITILIMIAGMCLIYYYGPIGVLYTILVFTVSLFIYYTILFIIEEH
jgi:hypothetical protein